MGLLAQKLQSIQIFNLEYTAVKLVSVADDKVTTINLVDPCYNRQGFNIKTIEFPSFEGEYGEEYAGLLTYYLGISHAVEYVLKQRGISNQFE